MLKKRQPVPGYDPALYASERIVARAGRRHRGADLARLAARPASRAGPQPLLLYGYGSYGIPIDPWFSQTRVSLLDRGVVFAIAHIRGGGDLGRSWYEAGKMAKKATTFNDFIACAETLIARGLDDAGELAIEGGSAGGLLMGAVVNQRPELFSAVVAEVPFVDVINTMLDETLPLTVGRVHRVGQSEAAGAVRLDARLQPLRQPQAAAPIRRCWCAPASTTPRSPTGSRPSTWPSCARLKTDANPLLLKINLEVGHGGASGRFDSLREIAEDDVFLLVELGLAS